MHSFKKQKALHASEAHARRSSRTRVGVELSSSEHANGDISVDREHYSGNLKRKVQYTI
jgi:hypothetical protein